jgi:hypothetical protein
MERMTHRQRLILGSVMRPAPLSKTPAISRFSRRARSRFRFCAKRREIAARLGRMGRGDGGPAWRACWSCARAQGVAARFLPHRQRKR